MALVLVQEWYWSLVLELHGRGQVVAPGGINVELLEEDVGDEVLDEGQVVVARHSTLGEDGW